MSTADLQPHAVLQRFANSHLLLCTDLCCNVSSVHYSLLRPEPAVILRLLELAALLHDLLVLGVERLPPGLHLPQLPGQGLQLLPVVIPGTNKEVIIK